MRRPITIALLITGTAAACNAQWLTYPDPRIPRTHDGKPDLTARAPRMPDGKPDLSGIWQIEPSPWEELKPLVGNMNDVFAPGDDLRDFSKYAIDILADFKPQDEPIRAEAKAAWRQGRPVATSCLPQGIPFVYLIPAPSKWVQTPGYIAIMLEGMNGVRQVYLDGRKPPAGGQPFWQGYSTGKWDGDPLVIDTVGFNDKTKLDAIGHPHSEDLHETARYHRRDFGHMDVEVTIDDPKMYTQPFRIKFSQLLQPDTDILEYVCEENEKDLQHMAPR
jgi:hypothetical protein